MGGTFTDEEVHGWLQEIADACWVSLHYDTPALKGIGACEIAGGGYVRQLVPMSQPANRIIWSLADARFTGLIQTQLTHFGIWTRKNNGRLRAYGELPKKLTVMNGKGYIVYEGELALSIG
jgi:hypothetical protein